MEKEDYIFVPFHIEKFRYYKNISSSDLWCYCTVNKEISNESILAGDITLYNENGELVAEIKNCETRKAPKKLLLQSFNALETEKYYQQNWIQKELEESDKNSLKNNKKWLIYSACDIEIKDLKKQINKEGNKYIFVSNSQNFIRESEHSYKINPNEDEQFKQIFEFNKDITNIVLISNSGANATEIDLTKIENGQNVCIAAVHLLKAILQVKFEISPTIQVVTSCTQQVFPEEIVSKPQYATLWGLFKVFRLEHPEYQCQLIDFSKEIEHDKLLQLINDETLIPIKESNIAFRNNERYVTRITKENKKTKEAISLNTDASYLITGGLGSLGLLFAKELAKRNVKNIVLTSRSKPSEYNTKKIKEIENNVTQIKTIQCDISNEDQVKILMKEIDQLKFPLKGIINAAGSLKDMPIEQLTPTSILDIMRPKIKGTWNIHKHTKLIDIDFFVCFSSMSSFIGTHYQANYAAANAFMDSFMTYRRSIGLKGLSINWGPWDKIGMANNLNDQYKSFIRKNGINFIDPEEGILVFDKLISKNQTNIAYLDIDWNKYTKGLIPLNKIAIFEELINRNYSQPEIEDEYINLLHNVSGEERNLLLNELISKEIAKITGSEISQFDVSTPLSVLGVDSLMAMEIRSIVQKKLNADIPIGKLLAGGNISDLAMIIEDELTTAQTDEQANINANNKEIEAFIEGEI